MFPQFRHIRDFQRLYARQMRRIIVDRSNPFEYLAEEEFLARFRLSKDSARQLIDRVKEHLPYHPNKRGSPVPSHLQVLVTLRYLATGNHQLTISDCYEISQSCASRCISRVRRIIGRMSHEFIKFPVGQQVNQVIQAFKEISGMPGIIGCIDCTHVAINRPSGDQPELFRNRKGFFSLNIQAVCGPDLKFYNIVARWYGSAHDSNIFDNSHLCQELEDGVHQGYLLGDNGYPCRRYLLTPLQNPRTQQEHRYNTAHIRTRNVIERAFGVLKRRFACLGKKMQTSLDNTKMLIVAAVVLHNFCIRYNVPVPNDVVDIDNEINEEALQVQDGPANIHGNVERLHFIRNNF